MALTVEDGSKPAGSNCYISVADADAYHLARDGTVWAAATTGVKEAAILRATDWLNSKEWGTGTPLHDDSSMAWPRTGAVSPSGGAYPSTAVPQAVVMACAEVAGAIVSGSDPLAVQDRAINALTVGPISTVYDPASPQGPRLPAAMALLKGWVLTGGTIRLVR